MYAVVKTGGKQYRVAAGDTVEIERLPGAAGDIVTLDEVLMLGDGANVTIGAPRVAGASVAAEILEQARGPKIIVFKKRRRQNSRRKKGHRQDLTILRISEILTNGAKPSGAKAAAKKPAAKKAASFTDDVSLIGGVGPVLKKRLAEYGVTSLKEIAAMSAADVAKMDDALDLKGRAARDEWVEQAKELVAGKPPRAKTDRARADDEQE
ncbi:MAG TPA: 50S ribosomal protein L21 [Parvularcula sp.]|nr:50S ribosomal protein L21 [Parvularcula sp.]HBS33434.1 50S ribosomal protein L21 [Parvularcula sp.]